MKLELETGIADLDRALLMAPDGNVRLTAREVDVLRYLASRAPETVSRDELLSEVWKLSARVTSRAADNAMARLRAKIERDPKQPDHLITVHGEGYRLVLTTAPEPTPVSPARAPLQLGPVTIDLARQKVLGLDGPVGLSGIEVGLLERLLQAGGAVVPRDVLRRSVWGMRSSRGRALANAVSRLRAKIEVDPGSPRHLLTGSDGYSLEEGEQQVRLPAPRDAFVGRDPELARVRELLDVGTRIVVLRGPPGIGKSRTAMQAARARSSASCWVVDAEGVADAAGLVERVAQVLGVEGSGSEERVARVLRGRGEALLILDGVETMADDLGVVGRWADGVETLGFLVTTRVRTSLPGAVEVVLPPMSPEECLELFRVRGLDPAADPEATRDLAAALDGLPLAIELAVARSRLVGPRGLLEQLRDRAAQLPDDGNRSLTTALDDALAHLDEPVLHTALCASIFEGGFTIEALQAVVREGIDAASSLLVLLDHSLVYRSGDRFDQLSMIRSRARSLFTEAARTEAETRHGAWFAPMGDHERMLASERRDGQAMRVAYRVEVRNTEAASRRAVARGDGRTAELCALAANLGLIGRRSPADLAELLSDAWATPGAVELARLAYACAQHQIAGRQLEAAVLWATRSVEGSRGDRRVHPRALRVQAVVTAVGEGFEQALPKFEHALAQARAAGDDQTAGICLANLGQVTDRADERIARQVEALALLRPYAEQTLGVQANLGISMGHVARFDEARVLLKQAYGLAREVGKDLSAGRALVNLGLVEIWAGRVEVSRAALQGGREAASRFGCDETSIFAALRTAHLAICVGDLDDARRWAEQAMATSGGQARRLGPAGCMVLAELERTAGLPDQARPWIDVVEGFDRPLARCLRARIDLDAGADGAVQELSEALDLHRPRMPVEAWSLDALLAFTLARRGETEAARAQLVRFADPEQVLPLVAEVYVLLARAHLDPGGPHHARALERIPWALPDAELARAAGMNG